MYMLPNISLRIERWKFNKDYGVYEGAKQVATVHIESSEECTRQMIIQSFGKSGYGPQI